MGKSRKKRNQPPSFELELRKIPGKKRSAKPLGPSYPDLAKLPATKQKPVRKRRVIPDLTADLSKYTDNREPVMPGSTIKNEFRKYPWRNSPYDTVKR